MRRFDDDGRMQGAEACGGRGFCAAVWRACIWDLQGSIHTALQASSFKLQASSFKSRARQGHSLYNMEH
ncbi:hypothetical protein PENSPDRAFT_60740 [Peniophora sp. CONT]|nr:hypothetical protein PENSPDRAFT_60740 [Peniophora sp. CONT]